MSSLRPYSSNIFKNKSNKKKIPLIKALSDIYSPKINNTFSKTLSKTPTPLRFLKEKSNIFAKSNENLDLLNLIIKSSPNQYNQKKINKKIVVINPLYIRGTEENLKRPNFNPNTEKVFYKYNLLYGNNTSNLIRTYSPKMRPMSSSISEFNKTMSKDSDKSVLMFNEGEILELVKARCKDIGIRLRENMVYKFTNFINSKCRNRCADLSDCYLGIHSIKFISKIIYKADRIARLNLTKNNLGDYGIEILLNAIKHSNSLISLNLTSNNITYKGGQIIFKELADQISIIDLNISSIEGTNRNHLNYPGMYYIEYFFNKNKYIETLNLCGNSIKDEGFILLCKALYNNKNLQNLSISNNDIHSAGLEQGLPFINTCKIISLNISQNHLLDSGIKILSNSLKNFPNLRDLNLSNCDFEFNGFHYLLKELSKIKNIYKLDISGNNLKNKNFEIVKPYFDAMSIRNLNISKCFLGNDGCFVLGDCLLGNESIKKLNISSNKISDKGFKHFIDIFSSNSNIESFDCSNNLITDLSGKYFVQKLRFNHTLTKINLFDNQLTNIVGNSFLELIRGNKTLRTINLLFNRIQMRTIEEINRVLKYNHQNERSKYIPDLHKSIKNLQFKPEMFKYYEKNIKYKKLMQTDLYKRVKQDDKQFSKLIKKENKKIDIKINQKINIESQIKETQDQIKDILQQINILQEQAFENEKDIERKIEIEKKICKKYKDENDMLKIEYNTNKKSFDDIIKETIEKQKKIEEKVNLAEITVNSKLKEVYKKREILSKLYDPDNLVPIKANKIEMIKDKFKKNTSFFKKSTFNYTNFNSFNKLVQEQNNIGLTNTSNENILTTASGNNDNNKKENLKKTILKKSISKAK